MHNYYAECRFLDGILISIIKFAKKVSFIINIKVHSNGIFRDVHRSRARYIAMKGSAGSGKSVDTAQQYIIRLLKDKGRNLLCMRKAEITNRFSTYNELVGAVKRMSLTHIFKCTTSPLSIKCVNGNRIFFRGALNDNEREKLKSITAETGKLTDIWLEEATEFTKNDFEIIDDRLRGVLPENYFYQIKLTFNPVSSSHWIKGHFFDRSDPDIMTHSSNYLNNRFVDPAYHSRMMRRAVTDPEGYKVYGLGEWGETGGLILHNWEMEDFRHNMEYYDDVAIGQDFGFNHANAVLTLGIKDGELYIIKEIYETGKDTAEIIKIAEAEKLPKNKHMYCDSAEPDRIRMWRKAGYRAVAVKKEQSSVKSQIDWLKQRKIFVHPSCRNTIKELGMWKWKMDSISGKYTDEPVGFFDDAAAALRYGIEGWRKGGCVEVLK